MKKHLKDYRLQYIFPSKENPICASRVLARLLSQEIPEEDLKQVSGGHGQGQQNGRWFWTDRLDFHGVDYWPD